MLWLAWTGWALWLVTLAVWAWQRRARPDSLPILDADGVIAVLLDAAGARESERQMRGVPPARLYRPHGRRRTTVYRRVRTEGSRVFYQAEAA